MNKNWTEVIKTTVPQYPLKGYGALSVVYNSVDEQELVVAGYASPQVVDREKHLITKKALAGDLERFLAHPHYRNAMLLHSNVQVGEVLPRWTNPDTGETWETKVDDIGLFAVVKVRTDPHRPTIVDKVIQDIRDGKIASFSISADAPFESRRYECVDGACFWIIDSIEYYEITLCETPVNQDANFTILSKAVADEFKASAFCQDGSCPITTYDPIPDLDKTALRLRKAALDKAPLGGPFGPRGNGVADPVDAIPAAKPKEAIDPRKPDRQEGHRAGGNAGAGSNAIAKDFPVKTGDLSYAKGIEDQDGDEDTHYAESEEYYLNKTGYYFFDDLKSLIELALDRNLPLDLSTRLSLAAIQRGPILKGFSYINKNWVVWSDSFPSAINKDHAELKNILDDISNKAYMSAEGEVWNQAQILLSQMNKRAPVRGTQAVEAFNDVIFRMVSYANPLDKCGLEMNGKAIASMTDKGYNIGWVGNAQRALNNAVEAIGTHVINNEQSRLALSPDILAALDVLYEDMQAVADNLGMGRELEKFKVMGDQPIELDVINEVALSTVSDVQEADLLLEKVDYDMQDLNDPDQQFVPDNNMVQTGVVKGEFLQDFTRGVKQEAEEHANSVDIPTAGKLVIDHIQEDPNYYDGKEQKSEAHSDSAMLAWFLPPELAQKLAIPSGEAPEELHMTLAYFPDKEAIDPNMLLQEIVEFAAHWAPFEGTLGGVGRFTGKKDVCYVSVDAPKLPLFRSQLLDSISAQEDQTHGYVPHITLAYLEEDQPSPVHRLPAVPVSIDSITLMYGGERKDIPLGSGGLQKAIQNKNGASPMNQLNDFWAPTHKTDYRASSEPTGDHELDTNMSGAHNPVVVIDKNMEAAPTHVETPADAVNPNAEVQHRESNRPEFDTRGALRAGDEDAKQLALGLGRIFHRTVNDARYKLAIVKDEDGQQRIIDLGY